MSCPSFFAAASRSDIDPKSLSDVADAALESVAVAPDVVLAPVPVLLDEPEPQAANVATDRMTAVAEVNILRVEYTVFLS